MAAYDRFERVLENLYKAALGDVEWASVASMINDMIGTSGHSVTYVETGRAGEPEIQLSRFFVGAERRDDLERLYYRDYYRRDEAIPRLAGLQDGELILKSDLYTDKEKKASAVYNEFRRINQTQHGFFIGLTGPDECGTVLSFGNSVERGGWGHDQIQAVRHLAPHLNQFARIRRALADAGALGATLFELLENRQSGVIQLDRRGRIAEANDRARGILLERDGLCDKVGVLAAVHPKENAELQRLVARSLTSYGVQGAGGSMKITRRKARVPLVLEIHPLPTVGRNYPASQVRTLVLVVDPAAPPRIDPDLAARLLGLTPTESRVAVAVATGRTVADTADALGCAATTVKTHLKRVYRKLGVHKQTELARRILSLEALRGPRR